MKNKSIFIFLAVISIMIFSSCNPDGPGIFYTISTEKKIASSVLSDKAVYKVISYATDIYVLAGAAIYKQDGSSWTKISPPEEGMLAVSLGRIGGGAGSGIFAVYESESGGSLSDTIYKLSGGAWTADSGTASIAGSLNLALVDVDNSSAEYMFISRRTDTATFEIYAYKGTALSTAFNSGKGLPLTGASVHDDGSYNDYYLTASNSTNQNGNSALYFYDTSDGTNYSFSDITASAAAIDFSNTLGGISENSALSTLYISSGDGFIYSSTDGTNWLKINSTALTDSYGNTASLGDMAVVSYNSSDYLIIAAGNGYFEMDLSGSSPQLPQDTAVNFSTFDLSRETVFSLYTATDNIYFGSELGLWLSTFSNGTAELDQE